jgi:hypothetical protein
MAAIVTIHLLYDFFKNKKIGVVWVAQYVSYRVEYKRSILLYLLPVEIYSCRLATLAHYLLTLPTGCYREVDMVPTPSLHLYL